MKGISLLEVLRFEELSRIPVYRTLRLHVGLPNMVCAVPSDARSGSAPSYAREPASIKTDGKTSLSLSLCPSHVASIIAKIISKSNVLSLEKFSGKYILDNEWIIIFQFE